MKNFLFGVILVLTGTFYGYHKILFFKPQAIHAWRQADGASIALQYYQKGMNFFKPQIHNYISDNGTSNFCTTGDAPILYYGVAALYKIFGPHDFIYRLVNTLIFFLGLLYLFKLFYLNTKDFFWSGILSLIIFTSPVLAYYANNYLPNTTALSFAIIGLYHFMVFTVTKKNRYFIYSMLLICLAGLLKITALLMYFAILGVFIFERLRILKTNIFHQKKFYWVSFLMVLGMNLAWVTYAYNFNKIHGSTYFSTTIFPVWNYNFEEIKYIIGYVYKSWFGEYYHISLHLINLGVLVYVIIFLKKIKRHFIVMLLILFAGIVVYVITQFFMFHDHDYYTINLYILPLFVILMVSYSVKENHPAMFRSLGLKLVFAALLLFNMFYVKDRLWNRYEQSQSDTKNNSWYSVQPYLRQIGIIPEDKIISLPDNCLLSLYLMNQEGWTTFCDSKFFRGKSECYNHDSASIQKSMKNGAKYLVVRGIETFYQRPYLFPFTRHLKGRYHDLYIFDLGSPDTNFVLNNSPELKKHWLCGAETPDEKGEYCYAENDSSQWFIPGGERIKNSSYNGHYVVRLDSKKQFGFTTEISQLKPGEKIIVRVAKSPSTDAGIIVASGKDFYKTSEVNSFQKGKNNWQIIELSFMVPYHLNGQNIKIYLYNPSGEIVLFDDLEIIRYESILPG